MFAEKIPFIDEGPSALEPNRTFAGQSPSPSLPVEFMPNAAVAARFCADRQLTLENYEQIVFETVLHSVARHLRTFLSWKSGYFAMDREIIRQIGQATSMKEVDAVLADHIGHRENLGLLRGRLKLRISSSHLRRLAAQYLSEPVTPEARNVSERTDLRLIPDRGTIRKPFLSSTTSRPTLVENERPLLPSAKDVASAQKKTTRQTDIAQLQQEVVRLTEQREILKKAIGIISEDPSIDLHLK